MIVIIFSNDLFMMWANLCMMCHLALGLEILNYILASAFSHKYKDEKQKQNKIGCISLSCSEVFIGAGFKTCPFRFFAFFQFFGYINTSYSKLQAG